VNSGSGFRRFWCLWSYGQSKKSGLTNVLFLIYERVCGQCHRHCCIVGNAVHTAFLTHCWPALFALRLQRLRVNPAVALNGGLVVPLALLDPVWRFQAVKDLVAGGCDCSFVSEQKINGVVAMPPCLSVSQGCLAMLKSLNSACTPNGCGSLFYTVSIDFRSLWILR
jgi:hypothetical protein